MEGQGQLRYTRYLIGGTAVYTVPYCIIVSDGTIIQATRRIRRYLGFATQPMPASERKKVA